MSDGHEQASLAGLSDAALLHRLSLRDAAAFRVLVERHGAVPHRVALRLLGSVSDAEDVMQEALLRLWRLATGADRHAAAINSPGAWLRQVATNLSLDRLRSRQRRPDSGLELTEIADGAPLADAQIEEMERSGAAQRAIARLPDRQRAAIVLTYYEGLANAAAAQVLELNHKAFESLLVRARKALKAQLAPTLAMSLDSQLERNPHDRI
ncbi:sigma-70 family RNA polymerase sigma factor [Novosphingobium sp.]|uniref:sigma-70 family RNA polymerase sigma factor n=1 Tax=Novosphingobium sp. TaxID=1874826 RepID=UPI002636DFA2|nr:sigma-70 family RNA polymerase sigma factor [Novosphingobium sp.]